MTVLETNDRLCAVVRELAELVNRQATLIEEHLTIDKEIKDSFSKMRDEANDNVSALFESIAPNQIPEKGDDTDGDN